MSPHRSSDIPVKPFVLLVLLAACADSPVDPPIRPPSGGGTAPAIMGCVVEVASGVAECTTIGAHGTGGVQLQLIPDAQWMVETMPGAYTPADSTYRLNVRISNTTSNTFGTRDGTEVLGFKVFLPVNPMGYHGRAEGDTSDPYGMLMPPLSNINNSARARNPDGIGAFTGPDQPFWNYTEILEPYMVSDWREWQFTLHPDVSYFYFAVGIYAPVPGEDGVPMRAPEHIPSWLYDPANSVRCEGLLMGDCVPNVLKVWFHSSATQSEREAAVELIDGTLIGGSNAGYYVQIPMDPTLGKMSTALNRLRQLTSVLDAFPFSSETVVLDHLTAYDEPDWRKWQLHPDSADGENWALEQIAAPSAWGCSVGDTLTKIGIVDAGFFAVSDLSRQRRTAGVGFGITAGAHHDHGTRVASVAAAFGNDSSQMAGVMWRANLQLWDVTVSGGVAGSLRYQMIWTRFREAAEAGAQVINVSIGREMTYNPETANPNRRAEAEANVRQDVVEFRRIMDTLAAHGRRPLVVFSAGNSGELNVHTRWNIARIAADSADHLGVPYNVLIVGASTREKTLAPFSQAGAHVIAPGSGTYVLHSTGQVDSVDTSRPKPRIGTGTSIAAPHVTGIAGLLFSFDPRLTSAEVRDLIVRGAQAGGRSAGGTYIVNAHESLRLAARRPGAPLCGNRVWIANDKMMVSRDTSGSITEELFITPESARDPRAMHGGKAIALRDTLYKWNDGSWAIDTTARADSVWFLEDPVYRSRRSISHDRDSVAYSVSTPTQIEVVMRAMSGGPTRLIGRVSAVERAGSGGYSCTRKRTADTIFPETCLDSAYIGDNTMREEISPRLSPRGDGVLVGFARMRRTSMLHGDWYVCPGQANPPPMGHELCHNVHSTHGYLDAKIYWISTRPTGSAGATPQLRLTDPGVTYRNMALADGPLEFTAERAGNSGTSTAGWVIESGWLRYRTIASTSTSTPCSIQFRHVITGALLQSISGCSAGGDPTIAPSRSAPGQLQASHTAPGPE